MTGEPVRDPLADHLITPQNAALLPIDCQPSHLVGVRSMDRALLLKNAVVDGQHDQDLRSPVIDAIGGTSPEVHRTGLDRVIRAGGQPISWVLLACELQRDWTSQGTPPPIVEIVLTERLLKER
jgi:hypothetical protein